VDQPAGAAPARERPWRSWKLFRQAEFIADPLPPWPAVFTFVSRWRTTRASAIL